MPNYVGISAAPNGMGDPNIGRYYDPNQQLMGGSFVGGSTQASVPGASVGDQGASLGSMSTQPYQMPSGSGFGGMSTSYNSTAPNSASMGGLGGSNGMGSANPYLQQQITALQNSSNQNLMQNVLPSINSGAMAAGQYGGSRQGAAQGMAIGNAQTGLDAATAGLLSGNYQFDQNLGLGYQNSNNQYNLGMGALNNQATASNQNFYTNQRGQDLQQLQLGANLFGQGVSGNAGLGQGIYGTGQQAYNAGQGALNNYGAGVASMAGYGGSSTVQGGPAGAGGYLGGALAGNQIAQASGMPSLGSLWGGGGNTYAPINGMGAW